MDAARLPPIRIGLVENHPVFREGIRSLLQSDPGLLLVGEASDHDQGLALAEKESPHVLLVDIALGRGPNGIALTRTLGERQPGVHVLVLSAKDGTDYLRGAYEAGARGYALKDDPLPKVLVAIHAVAAGGTFWPPGVVLGPIRPVLTTAQLRVARLLGKGHRNREVANLLGISERTAESHRRDIFERTGTRNTIELLTWLEARGLLDHPDDPSNG